MRGFPNPSDGDRVRKIFADSMTDDALDLDTLRENAMIPLCLPRRSAGEFGMTPASRSRLHFTSRQCHVARRKNPNQQLTSVTCSQKTPL